MLEYTRKAEHWCWEKSEPTHDDELFGLAMTRLIEIIGEAARA